MDDFKTDDRNRWFNRILKKRRKYFFEYLRNLNGWSDFSLIQTFGWIKDDVVYSTRWSINILLQIRAYGSIIRTGYGCSFLKQFSRMMYLTFVKRVDPKYFRSYLLFLEERWRNVDRFVFDQYDAQYQLVDKSYPEEKEILKSKLNFYKYCKKKGIHTPEVIGAFEYGELIYPYEKKMKIPDADIFVKDIFGKSGQGVKKFHFAKDHFFDNTGKIYSQQDIADYLTDYSKKGRGTIVQRAVKNHSSWLPFTSGSLATCRIVIAKVPFDDTIKPLFCILRMPIGNLDADNFALGGIASAMNPDTGVFKPALAVKPLNGFFLFDKHPDTMQTITANKLPYFNEIIDYATNVQSMFKTKFLGWDIALTDKGPCVIEGNIGWGADIVESPHNTPLIDTDYPDMFEKWMRIFSE